MENTNHPYQLREIELADFKSVQRASVHLRPITVVVGANSSGKSTLLQSILAVTQAVRSDTSAAEFPLNGEFVKLGTFSETKNFHSSSENSPITFGFTLVGNRYQIAPRMRSNLSDNRQKLEVGWRAYLEHDDNSESGFARIVQLELDIRLPGQGIDDPGTRLLTCDLSAITRGASLGEELPRIARRRRTTPTAFPMVGVDGRLQDWRSGRPYVIHTASLQGGVPREVLSRQQALSIYCELWWSEAHRALHEILAVEANGPEAVVAEVDAEGELQVKAAGSARRNLKAVAQAEHDILEYVARYPDGEEPSGSDVDAGEREFNEPGSFFYETLAQLPDKYKKSVARSIFQIGWSDFSESLHRRLRKQPWSNSERLVEPPGAAGLLLSQTGALTQRFFRTQVRYLGPLREAPHVLYDPGPSRVDLGPKGEYSAAVLHAQARTRVVMPTEKGEGEVRRLDEALNYWLARFGLIRSVKSQDRGRLGIGLEVTPMEGDRPVDLTSVGVGVSQALPVVLLCLLAAPGTLVMIEQPELHLHPKLQQHLSDFLLACARSGRQLLIETHSEHMINQLRTRIAEDETDETRDLIQLLFAEQTDGVTAYRESKVNAYGGLEEDWPEGFLDLGALEAQALVRESLAKRRRERNEDQDAALTSSSRTVLEFDEQQINPI